MFSIGCLLRNVGLVCLLLRSCFSSFNNLAGNGLTCQGSSYAQGLSRCPDQGTQRLSIGGNVTMYVRSANNLANLDSTGPASAVSDPYVKFTVGKTVAVSKVVRNNLNPEWNDYVNLGVLGSATEITVEVWDADSGLEMADDLIAATTMRVPFCSTFNANYSEVDCGIPFGCRSDDSLWTMPNRQQCTETAYLTLNKGRRCTAATGSCLIIDVLIIPFTMKSELRNKNAMLSDAWVTAAAPPIQRAKWTYNFGRPFKYDDDTTLDMRAIEAAPLKGALAFQIESLDKAKGSAGAIKFYAGINFPATIYVCRSNDDNKKGIPAWIKNGFDGRNSTIYQMQLSQIDTRFGCYYYLAPGTRKNRWGGIIDGAIPFGSNTVPGRDVSMEQDQVFYDYMYIVLAIPRVIEPRNDTVVFVYDSGLFIESFFSHGLIFSWFMFLAARFLDRIDYRIDRLTTWLVTRVLTGDDKSLIATLFLTYRQSPCNIEYRAHLFHAENALKLFLIFPILLLAGWGFSCSATVRPAALGFGIFFLGSAAIFLWFGFNLWERGNWRLSPTAITSVAVAILLFLSFIISVIFLDPAVVAFGQDLNFAALSLLFGTINTFPLLLLIFKQDKTYKSNLKHVIQKMGESVALTKDQNNSKDGRSSGANINNSALKANRILHALLRESYTINPNIPYYKFATVLQELPKQVLTDDGLAQQRGDDLYNASLFILFVYLLIAITRTEYPSLAFLNCLTLILLDAIHTSIARGDVNWSPGYKIALLVIGRMVVMGSGPDLWLLYYSVMYFVYSFALIQEMINTFLPKLSKRQANEAVFASKEDSMESSPDISGSTFFCMGWLTFCFIAMLLVSSFGDADDQLPVPMVLVWDAQWPAYAFGIISICVVITGGLMMATVRSFYLQKHGLLRGWARTIYMVRRSIDSPKIFALFSEISILSSGILIYAVTKCNSILILCVFLPIVISLLGYAFNVWVSNEYDLVVWPPKNNKSDKKDDSPTDLEVAFHMIENLFGEEKQEIPETEIAGPQERTLKGFKLPSLDSGSSFGGKLGTGGLESSGPIKMPPLPLKSVLRRKRQAMGIKVKPPVVKDLRIREGGDIEKFGSGVDVLDAKDPWAQFEENEEDRLIQEKAKKKKVGVQFKLEDRAGFMSHPHIVAFRDFIKNSKTCQYIIRRSRELIANMKSQSKKYMKAVSLKDEDDEDDAAAEDDEDKEKGPTEADEDDGMPQSENFDKMPFWKAVIGGFLTKDEYYALFAWFGGMFFLMIMGIAIADNNRPNWIGHVLWVGTFLFILTAVPVIKYFNTFTLDKTSKYTIGLVLFLHLLFCVFFFAIALDGDPGLSASLWILDYFFYYPAFLYMACEFYKWIDDGFKIEALDKDGDGQVTYKEYLAYFKAYPILFLMMIILNWHFYLWISQLFGQVITLVILVGSIGYVFIRDWAINDFFLSNELVMIGNICIQITCFISFSVALFSNENPSFSLSVFFFALTFKYVATVTSKVLIMNADTVFFFSPYVMPVYSYDPKKNDLIDETPLAKQFVLILLLGALWGAAMATFLYPVNVGIAVACSFLLIISAVMATTMTFIPLQLGRYANALTAEEIIEAASAAKMTFFTRRLPLSFEMSSYTGHVANDSTANKGQTSLDRAKEGNCLDIATELLDDTRALTYVQDDADFVNSKVAKIVDDEEVAVPWYQEYFHKAKTELVKLFELIAKKKGWRKHSEAMFTATDAMAEAIIVGRGPYGFMGLEGSWYKLFQYGKTQPRLAFLNQPWLNVYDEFGNSSAVAKLAENMDSVLMLTRFRDLDQAMDHAFLEEFRCSVHFLLMLIVGAESKMQREQVLFQKFLRENRFRLASNGITPPAELFSSSSFASIDIPLTAVWLSTLSHEERDRFQLLKTTFYDEQKERDEAVDNADYQMQFNASTLKSERSERELEYSSRLKLSIQKVQAQKAIQFGDTLNPVDKSKFQLRKDLWMSNPDCIIDSREQDLYNKFREAFAMSADEYTEYARIELANIEAAQKDCRMGEYGRAYQFVDSDFPPTDNSIGESQGSTSILGWRCAPGISEGVQLFNGGTDPDDVQTGVFADTWLLSAVSMLAAAGGVGDGGVDEQIMNLFVGHYAVDGEITHFTEVGAYCVKLFKQGFWNPIIVDDLFPMRRKDDWTNENHGMACAHAKEVNGLWVSLIEKAFAKYYGSYAALEKGFVTQALEDMTGCEAETIPLASAARGLGKQSLWDSLIHYKKNGYIIGAGTGSSSLVDREIQDMGIVFNAAYTIYDIRSVDGHKLLKLRNPPGEHDEWKGDWGDKSSLWTKRMKGKLGYVDADDNTFYMCFDDFVNVFRDLYVCKWYNPSKWKSVQYPGQWKKPDLEAAAKAAIQKQMMMEQDGMEGVPVPQESDADRRKAARAAIDTSGGIPSKHNPGCVLENNPHYSLTIYRPTDIRITVTQTDSRGHMTEALKPFAFFIVKNAHPKTAMRLTQLDKENVICSSGEPRAERVQYLYTTLPPGLYIVFVPPYVAGMQGHFNISVMANFKNDFQPIWPPKWMMKGEKGKVGPGEVGFLMPDQKSKAQSQLDDFGKFIKKGMATLLGGGDNDSDSDDEEEGGNGDDKAPPSSA